MSIWNKNDLPYLLFLFNRLKVQNFDELYSIIFLLNYYNLLENGKRFFGYTFVKSGNFINAIELDKDIEEIILSDLVSYKKGGYFSITNFGERLLQKFNRDFSTFNKILSRILSIDYNREVNDFVLVQRAKEMQEIRI